jgi:hypothetical protein
MTTKSTSYTIDKELVETLVNDNYNNSSSPTRYGKTRLISTQLLSKVFNAYLDIAEKSCNFTELDNLSDEEERTFNKAIAKNFLFILSLIHANDSSVEDVLKSVDNFND